MEYKSPAPKICFIILLLSSIITIIFILFLHLSSSESSSLKIQIHQEPLTSSFEGIENPNPISIIHHNNPTPKAHNYKSQQIEHPYDSVNYPCNHNNSHKFQFCNISLSFHERAIDFVSTKHFIIGGTKHYMA